MIVAVHPGISIVVVNWNHVDELLQCLRSLYDAGADQAQVIVVDNGSVDASVATVRREFPMAEVIETGANLGFAEGANRGIDLARGEWVFTFNNDATLAADGLALLGAEALAAQADVGMLQPTLCFKDRPGVLNSTGIMMQRSGFPYDRGFNQPADPAARSDEVFCCTAGAALYRRTMLDAVRLPSGWFDRGFFMYFEDLDLGWRCRLAGWRALHVPAVRALHRFQGSSVRHGASWLERTTRRNRVRTLLKNASLPLLARLSRSLGVEAARSLRLDPEARRHLWAAFADGWSQRGAVGALARVPRRELETRWFR